MSGTDRKRTGRDDFLRYMAGEMSDSERNAFEKELQRDLFAADAAEGLSFVDTGEARADLDKLQNRIRIRAAKRNLIFYSGVAAVVLLFIVSSVIFFRPAVEPISVPPAVAEQISTEKEDTLAAAKKVALAAAKTVTDEAAGVRSEEKSGVVATGRETMRTDTPVKAAGVARPLVVSPVDTVLQLTLAEGKNITGIVTDEQGRPFPFVNVYIKGQTRTGVITGEDGRFIIPVKPDTGITIVAAFVGYKQLLVQADKPDLISIRMEPDIKALDEVVVVGFGEQRKDFVGAIPAKTADRLAAYTGLRGEIAEIISRDSTGRPFYIPPAPVAGLDEFHQYIRKNIRRPVSVVDVPERIVEIDLPVSAGGEKGSPLILKSPGEPFSAEAKRLLVEGPQWKPATMNGLVVNDTIRIRIRFDL